MVNLAIRELVRCGGPGWRLRIRKTLGEHPPLLTPEVIAAWTPKPWHLRSPPDFYAALLEEIRERLAAERDARTATPNTAQESTKLQHFIQEFLQLSGGVAPLCECMYAARRHPDSWHVGPSGFVSAARRAPGVEIILRSGCDPELRLTASCQGTRSARDCTI